MEWACKSCLGFAGVTCMGENGEGCGSHVLVDKMAVLGGEELLLPRARMREQGVM